MRAVCWSVAALALLAVTSALRTTQVEGASRSSRRLPAPIAPDSPAETNEPPDEKYTVRPRPSRRREEFPAREARTRSRSRSTEKLDTSTEAFKSTSRNERFDSRRNLNRASSRNVEVEKTTIGTYRERSLRSRTRPNLQTSSTTLAPEVSSPVIDETKIEVINSNLEDLARTSPAEEKTHAPDTTQFKRRSSTLQTTERIVPVRIRNRINTRPKARSLDLEVAGTTNSLTDENKEPTTERSGELRNSRKLRYKTRLSETDTNLTGEGLKSLNDVTKSSQSDNNVASQPEMQASPAVVVENSITQQSTESLLEKTTASKSVNVFKKRPLSRGKINYRPSGPLTKSPPSDEISEDDNYPASFKALIQAKNASTQASSPQSESLSVKASQKVYKTYTASSQSTNIGTGLNKYTRLRSKLGVEKKEDSADKTNQSSSTELPKPKSPEFRPRGSFTPRNRKSSSFPSSTSSAPTSSRSPEKAQSKFNRKFKITTTESPLTNNSNKTKRTETNALIKKSARSPYYQRKGYQKKNVTTENNKIIVEQKDNTSSTVDLPVVKSILPRTSYYSRLRNRKNETTSTTTSPVTSTESTTILSKTDKKNEDSSEMPLLLSLLGKSANVEMSSEKIQSLDSSQQQDKEMFIIAVSSTESQEKTLLNDVTNTAEESENNAVYNTVPTTMKYHANYRDFSSTVVPDSKENMISSTISPAENIPTRKYGRKFSKAFDVQENVDVMLPKPREKSLRKYSESFSKTTEASTNGIAVEPEKSRGRFSSKYRGPHAERPIYKATVPTITTSTAWLKFFVTDQLLTKSLEEPNWFEEDVRTESMAKQITVPPIIHESSLQLVEGEEIDLGPDMNAISFTKPRSKLSSADLRLSESLIKPSHVMNVEATHHSPSVTVSIFDALAEILTSTPRTQLSSTTEVIRKQNTNNDVTQIFNGVSNINVNSVGSSLNKGTLTTSADINTSAKTVQAIDQTTPIVINRLSVGEGVTPSLNNDLGKIDPVNTLQTAPTPTPTTPVSARKPFAIRVLYSDTEPTVDKFTTSTVAASIQPPTDSTMVYNTVSDLLLSNNNLVSSELTSMLSNNIRSIIQNMDESSRSRITLDMAKLLKTLIPRAIDGLATVVSDVDSIPSTTPYSLEDLKDTENIDVDISNDANVTSVINILQNGFNENNVNSTENRTKNINENDLEKTVNSTGATQSTISVSSSQNVELSTNAMNVLSSTTTPTTENLSEIISVTPSDSIGTDTVEETFKISARSGLTSTDSSIYDLPRFPFLTNFRAEDFNPETESPKIVKSAPLTLNSSSKDVELLDIDDPSQISKFQLWVLSKKARVLKMIEDIIRQHNDEIATAQPLTDMISQTNNIPLSDRLTKIITDMGLTTETTVSNDDIDLPTVAPNIFVPFNAVSNGNENKNVEIQSATTVTIMSPFEEILSTTPSSDVSERFAKIEEDKLRLTNEATTQENIQQTETNAEFDIFNRNLDDGDAITIDTIADNGESTTMQLNTETTTDSLRTETTTEDNVVITTEMPFELTTANNVTESNVSDFVPVKPIIPKKDYVIFGILPNNTVVRKDPNDNALESLTEASPYIVYGVLPNNTVIRKFPNGTRVPRVMQKIDILPISPWSLKNPYSPIHNNPAIVRPQSNPNRVSSNIVTSTDASNNGTENLTYDTVNNLQITIPPSALNTKNSGSLGITTATNMPPAEKSTASHVLSLRTTTMLPSVDEILLNSISSAAKEEIFKSSMTSSTSEPRILTLDIDPETKEIRTEKPGDGTGNAVFKFIPIDQVTVAPQNTNVLKLASTKASNTGMPETATVANSQIPEIQSRLRDLNSVTSPFIESDSTTSASTSITQMQTPTESYSSGTLLSIFNELTTSVPTTTIPTTTLAQTTSSSTTTSTTTPSTTTTTTTPSTTTSTTTPSTTTTTTTPSTTTSTTTPSTTTTTTTPSTTTSTTTPSTTTSTTTTSTTPSTTTTTQGTSTEIFTFRTTVQPSVSNEEQKRLQQDAELLQELLRGTVNRSPKNLNTISDIILNTFTTTVAPTSTTQSRVVQRLDEAKLLQALLGATGQNFNTVPIATTADTVKITSRLQTTTSRSIEDDIRQFEEDTKLLKALLQATGQNPANFNIPTLDIKTTPLPKTTTARSTTTPTTTTMTTTTTTTTPKPTTTRRSTTTQAIDEDIKKLQEDTRLLQALLQATGQNKDAFNIPVISGVTSNVRIASNPLTTSLGSNPTTPVNVRPVYKSRTTTPMTPSFTFTPRNIFSTFESSTSENIGISTTVTPFDQGRRAPSTASVETSTILSGRRAPVARVTVTTEMPSTSTFSVEEDLAFLKNLKTVLKTNSNNEDPEAALANRIIALAVERSLNEIESTSPNSERTGKKISNNVINNVIPTSTFTTTTTTQRQTTTTARPTTTTARPTTTTARPTTTTTRPTTTIKADTPSLEDDIKQFQEDTKLLQALLQATGQDPSKFNIPTLPPLNANAQVSSKIPLRNTNELNLLANILTTPLPKKPIPQNTNRQILTHSIESTTARQFGAKIAVKDELKTVQDDEKLLKTLVKLQDVQTTTTQRNKIAITGQSSDEALKKLLQSQQNTKSSSMLSQATQAPISLSTEFGKSNDALLAALLKEQGFGPTTASSLDEQLRLSALLNQVVVTPKARRTTTPPPPPPPPRRPILDGIAWLWQQWRETAPGPTSRPSRRPSPSASPAVASSAATSNRVNWFGSGPFVGNADEQPTSNRVPLEPPRAVTSEQTPGRGQLVSAAINVTRAFSQFLGAAIQGAAQTVQNVIRAGQRAATDVYVSGSGGSG